VALAYPERVLGLVLDWEPSLKRTTPLRVWGKSSSEGLGPIGQSQTGQERKEDDYVNQPQNVFTSRYNSSQTVN
jgi:hypothetical protein